MKSKTLALITAALITASALILTAGLSLLNTSAIDESLAESTADNGSFGAEIDEGAADENYPVIEDDPIEGAPTDEIPAYDPPAVEEDGFEEEEPEAFPPITENYPVIEDDPIEGAPTDEIPAYPAYEYTVGDPRNVYVGGGEGDVDVSKGVVIDVYSHKTGKLVGQLAFTSEEITSYISSLMRDEFKPENELWIEQEISCVALPEGDYRIEVYAGTWFSYTYGTSGIFELTQCTLTFSGGEKLTGYIDFLIADLIADIEAGNVEAPAPEMAVSKLEYGGLEGYWEGYYNEVCDMYIPGAGRWCERFPYIEE